MTRPPVSVVVAAYQAESTLRCALASVEAQTRPAREVIVVDDASTDATPRILRTECAGRAGCRVVRRETNGGPAAARNRGIACASGEWIAFLDADDAWHPERLALQLELAAKHPHVVLWCGNTVTFRDDAELRELQHKLAMPDTSVAAALVRPIGTEEFAEHNPVATSTVLVRKSALAAVGGFDERFRGPEDYDLWMRVSVAGRIRNVAAPLSFYRHRAGSLSLDDRTFLPEVLRVLQRAYAPGGALSGRSGKRRAMSYQYLAAAWMAAERRAPGAALWLLARAALLWPLPYRGKYRPLPRAKARLLWHVARGALVRPSTGR